MIRDYVRAMPLLAGTHHADYEVLRPLYFCLETTATYAEQTMLPAWVWERILRRLERRGLVRRYDDTMPMLAGCWDVTNEGVELIGIYEPEAVRDDPAAIIQGGH